MWYKNVSQEVIKRSKPCSMVPKNTEHLWHSINMLPIIEFHVDGWMDNEQLQICNWFAVLRTNFEVSKCRQRGTIWVNFWKSKRPCSTILVSASFDVFISCEGVRWIILILIFVYTKIDHEEVSNLLYIWDSSSPVSIIFYTHDPKTIKLPKCSLRSTLVMR